MTDPKKERLVNIGILERKLITLSHIRSIPARHISVLRDAITHCEGDIRLLRMNPVSFGARHGIDWNDALDLFICAARSGLFDFTWALICPSCGGILTSGDSINDLGALSVFCHICNLDVPLVMDDCVEVSFTINPDIHRIHIDPTTSFDSYRDFYFSPAVKTDPAFLAYLSTIFRGFHSVPGNTEITVSIPGFSDNHLRLVSAALHHQLIFIVSAGKPTGSNSVTVEIRGGKFICPEPLIHKGDIAIHVVNGDPETIPFSIFATDFGVMHRFLALHPSVKEPFVTGKMLLNNQTFRNLYRIQNLVPGLKLNIRSLTILFTDLKGSTELYDNIGDVEAYHLIQRHFSELTGSVSKHGGAIVKTMGDAIMATFSEPCDGVRAALDMMNGIRNVRTSSGQPLGLKIGIHEGPALAINNDGKLDYFGQTVNIAARVQGLAKAGEIWATSPIVGSPVVPEILREHPLTLLEHMVSLKGVGGLTKVYQYSLTI